LFLVALLGVFISPQTVYAQELNQFNLRVVMEDSDKTLVFEDLREFNDINELEKFLGNGNDGTAHERIGFFGPSWTFYVHSATKEEGLGNILFREWFSFALKGKNDELVINSDIYLNDILIGDSLVFVTQVKVSEEFQGEPGVLYINTCANKFLRIIYKIEKR